MISKRIILLALVGLLGATFSSAMETNFSNLADKFNIFEAKGDFFIAEGCDYEGTTYEDELKNFINFSLEEKRKAVKYIIIPKFGSLPKDKFFPLLVKAISDYKDKLAGRRVIVVDIDLNNALAMLKMRDDLLDTEMKERISVHCGDISHILRAVEFRLEHNKFAFFFPNQGRLFSTKNSTLDTLEDNYHAKANLLEINDFGWSGVLQRFWGSKPFDNGNGGDQLVQITITSRDLVFSFTNHLPQEVMSRFTEISRSSKLIELDRFNTATVERENVEAFLARIGFPREGIEWFKDAIAKAK